MTGEYVWDPGEANPKQKLFFASRSLYTAYGGAKGGGKTWAVRTKALLGAYNYAGIRILILRRTYPELQSNHIEPMLKMINPEFCSYNGSLRSIYFANGSLIHFGHWAGETSELEYNGQEYDWIFLDEATQFTWRSFQFLGGLLRGVNDFPKRMYITCNPGGVGHRWVKRLFIDRDFITDPDDPEAERKPGRLRLHPRHGGGQHGAAASPPRSYLRMLASMPEDLRRGLPLRRLGRPGRAATSRALRRRDACGGALCPPGGLAQRYRAFDYGLDMFACCWFAVDGEGRSWMYREYSAERAHRPRGGGGHAAAARCPASGIEATFAPPDMWNRQKDTGRTMAEIFMENGVPIVRADNNRVQGHHAHKGGPGPPGRTGGRDADLLHKLPADHRRTCSDIQADEDEPQRLRPGAPRASPTAWTPCAITASAARLPPRPQGRRRAQRTRARRWRTMTTS